MANRDIILVGGGESSKTIISSVMGNLHHKVRGVLFIDHDASTIHELYDEMSKYSDDGIQVRDVLLHKRVLDREKFDLIAENMSIYGGGVTWEDPLPNHPPMVRVQTQLWGNEILDALWDMLPTVGADDTHTGRLDEARVVIVFLFGLTGMTSSTVGVESAVVLRKRLRARLLNHRDDDVNDDTEAVINSTLDKGSMPLFVGVGCFPPDPTDGAGQYNILHGLRMSGVIKNNLSDLKLPREVDLANKPFNKFFLLDGSGAWRTQDNKDDYSEWVARTLSTLLTCQSVDAAPEADTFYDSIEMLDSCEPFSHAGLVMAGLTREEQKLLNKLRRLQELILEIGDTNLSDSQTLREIITTLQEANARAESLAQEIREAANQWQAARQSIPQRRWWWPFGQSKRQQAIDIHSKAELHLKNILSLLPQEIDDTIADLNSDWEKWSHQRIWAMPMPANLWLTDSLQDSLPLRYNGEGDLDHNIIQNRNNSRQSAHDMVRMLMRHLIDPMAIHPMKVKQGTMMLVGSDNVKRDYPLPDPEDMKISFGGDWNVLMSEDGGTGDPMHLLLWWQPEDGNVLPMYYRSDDSLKVQELPAEYDAWPSQNQRIGERADAQNE